jgi:ketosteroid isomerase-like protein
MSKENVEVVKAVFAAWKGRDPEAALKRIDPAVEIDMTGVSFPGLREVHCGHDGLQRALAPWLEAWESIEFVPEGFIDAGDDVIAWVRVVGKGRGSGVPVKETVASVYTIGRGLVVTWRAFDTLAAAASAVGI